MSLGPWGANRLPPSQSVVCVRTQKGTLGVWGERIQAQLDAFLPRTGVGDGNPGQLGRTRDWENGVGKENTYQHLPLRDQDN